jgi:DNA-binding NarL/FixJ family response regulator
MQRRSGSQPWELIERKEAWTRQLLERGLSVAQIAVQLRCSESFVRRVRREHITSAAARADW